MFEKKNITCKNELSAGQIPEYKPVIVLQTGIALKIQPGIDIPPTLINNLLYKNVKTMSISKYNNFDFNI